MRRQILRDTTTELWSSTFRFYTICGSNSGLENSKAPSFIEMLTRVKTANRRYKAIIHLRMGQSSIAQDRSGAGARRIVGHSSGQCSAEGTGSQPDRIYLKIRVARGRRRACA
jgi:hypothetical protein